MRVSVFALGSESSAETDQSSRLFSAGLHYLDGNTVLLEKQGDVNVAQYLWGNGLVRCNNEYPLTDGRVNVRLTTNASQQTISTSQPDSFGVSSVTAGTASAYGYGGAVGYREEGIAPAGLSTAYALQKVGARYYDQAFGAFLTRDTDLSQKPYAYCDGDPVNSIDPSGHQASIFPTTAETAAHNGILDTVQDFLNRSNFGSNAGDVGTYNPPDGFTFNPITFNGGSLTLGMINVLSSPTFVGNGSLGIGGGTFTRSGSYLLNGSGGQLMGDYNHPIRGGLQLDVKFGSGTVPQYGLKYTLSF